MSVTAMALKMSSALRLAYAFLLTSLTEAKNLKALSTPSRSKSLNVKFQLSGSETVVPPSWHVSLWEKSLANSKIKL